jgi:hypothetical protein
MFLRNVDVSELHAVITHKTELFITLTLHVAQKTGNRQIHNVLYKRLTGILCSSSIFWPVYRNCTTELSRYSEGPDGPGMFRGLLYAAVPC